MNVLAPGGSGTLVLDSTKLQSYSPGWFDASTFSGPVTVTNAITTGIAFKAGAGFMGLGVVSDTGTVEAAAAPYAWWSPRKTDGAGTRPTPEQSDGIANRQQYLRDHVAPLRAAKPQPVSAPVPDTTNVRLYRIFIETTATALRITDGS